MRYALARLDRERERLRHLRRPVQQHVLPGQPVERVVDFDGRKSRGVVSEHPCVLDVRGVKRALPLLERVAARSGEKAHDTVMFGV